MKAKRNNDNVVKKVKVTPFDAEKIARYLVEKLDNPEGWKFYCKIAYTLPASKIYELCEYSLQKAHNPKKYFSTIAKHELFKYGKR